MLTFNIILVLVLNEAHVIIWITLVLGDIEFQFLEERRATEPFIEYINEC